MTPSGIDPAARLHYAEEHLARAADQVQALLREAAPALQPFPPFPGALFSFGVEVEPEGVLNRDVGCVVVTETGDLKELQISLDADELGLGMSDPVSMRDERLVELELHPYDRLIYAYQGLRAITALLEHQEADQDQRGTAGA